MDVTARVFAYTGPLGDRFGDRSYVFLRALDRAGVPTRLIALGQLSVSDDEPDSPWRHWASLSPLVTTYLTEHFVNVVMAPLGYLMGTSKQTTKNNEVVYEPQTAFRHAHTADVVNVAIVSYSAGTHASTDLNTLANEYDEVYASSHHDYYVLREKGLENIRWANPAAFADRMQELLRAEGNL